MSLTFSLPRRAAALAFTSFVFVLLPCALRAQGPLQPPAAPQATMKTLAQVEPRTAIPAGGAYTISASGSYYLSGNIDAAAADSYGITVQADNVTIDLNGFTITGSKATSTQSRGIYVTGWNHVTIRNGNIAGFRDGIYIDIGSANNIGFFIEKLTISECTRAGIISPTGTRGAIIDHCIITSIGVASAATFNTGVNCFGGVTIQDCTVDGVVGANTANGLDMGAGSVSLRNVIRNCKTGISAGAYANNYCQGCTTALTGGTDGGGNFFTP